MQYKWTILFKEHNCVNKNISGHFLKHIFMLCALLKLTTSIIQNYRNWYRNKFTDLDFIRIFFLYMGILTDLFSNIFMSAQDII